MGRKKPIVSQLTIEGIAGGGKAWGKADGKVIFVSNAVPGDVVNVKLKRSRKSFGEGVPIAFHHYSELRTEPFCEHFGTCGGCKWQNLPYEKQLTFKQQEVLDCITRIGGVHPEETLPILPSEQQTYYRNKLEFTFSNRRWLTREDMQDEQPIENRDGLGFHIPRRFEKVLDIQKCWLQPDPSNAIRLEIKRFAVEMGMEFYDLIENKGFLRTLMIRTSSMGEVMVLVVFGSSIPDKQKMLLEHIQKSFPNCHSLLYTINKKRNDSLFDLKVETFAGKEYLTELIGNLKFKVGATSFFQVNVLQAEKLYKMTLDWAELTGEEIVYDLYTGTGSIALYVAQKAKRVVGMECSQGAIDDALFNSRQNGVENASFFAGDVKDILTPDFMQQHSIPDVVIADPPRDGMHPKVIQQLISCCPKRIIYISCKPSTQARDIALLKNSYVLKKIQPIDMFPHTHHVENIALLIKK